MATFIARAQEVLGQDVPVSSTDYFGDDTGDTHEENINAIAAERITGGVGRDAEGRDRYNPGAEVTRAEMGSFLARKLDRLVDKIVAEPPPTATLTPTSARVAGGAKYEGTVTASRGTIDSATVTGCRISPDVVVDVENVAGAATLPISVTIPADLAGIQCRLDILLANLACC